MQEPVVSEEVELIVESLLGVLLRTILEISNRPQPAGPAMRLQFQDVTVCVFYRVQHSVYQCVCVYKLLWDFKLSCCCGNYNYITTNIININGNN